MHLRDSHDQQPSFSPGLSQIPGLAQAAQSMPPLFLTEDVTLFTCPKASYGLVEVPHLTVIIRIIL